MNTKEIASKYLKAPTLDKEAVPVFKSLIQKITSRANEILQEYEVTFTNSDPYKTSLEMRKDLKEKKIKVYTWGDNHPVFNWKENNLFRLVYDVDWHWMDLSFSLKDEIKTHEVMSEKLKLTIQETKALFTEIVWQVSVYYETWNYTKQKAIFIN